jgi:phage-related protein
MPEKPLYWLGASLEDLRAFPKEARRAAGHQLDLVQQGLEPHDWKPMPAVGTGVYEIRVHVRAEYRVFYVAKFAEAYTCSTPSRSARDRRARPILILQENGSVI